MDDFYGYMGDLKQTLPGLIVSGDYNICHQPIDIHNPKSNAKSSGFLPEERNWLSKFVDSGFVDSFRHFNKEPHNYTWWSYRALDWAASDRGRRLDHMWASPSLAPQATAHRVLEPCRGWERPSDHVPLILELEV